MTGDKLTPHSSGELPVAEMIRYGLRHISLRRWTRSWLRTLVLVLIVGLGVGAFFAIRLANRAALLGFEWFSDSISGESPLVVYPSAGTLPVGVLPELRQRLGPIPVHLLPVLETTAIDMEKVPEGGDLFDAPQFQVLGMDVTALANLVYLNPGQAYRSPGRPGSANNAPEQADDQDLPQVFIPGKLAGERGWERGDKIPVTIHDRQMAFIISDILPENDFLPEPPKNMLLMDITSLQEVLNDYTSIHRVELQFPRSDDDGLFLQMIAEAGKALEPAESDPWIIMDQSSRRNSASQMTEGFRLNLSILSLLALIVGIYLIFQSLEASVARRRTEAAVLKSLGWRGQDIRTLWMVEALALGIAGSIFGLALGWAGAQLAVGGIARTVNALYYSNTVSAASFDSGEALVALVIGVAASLVAAWLPAFQVSNTPPAHQLGRDSSSGAPIRAGRFAAVGICVAVAGLVFSMLPPYESGLGRFFPVGGYFASLFWLVAMGMIAIGILPAVSRWISRRFPDSVEWVLAASQLRRPTIHHFWAMAGLVAAIGMASGMGILITSFESTIVKWMNQILRADVYIASSGITNASSQNRIPESTWKAISTMDAVQSFDLGRIRKITLDGRNIWLLGAPESLFSNDSETIWIRKPDRESVSAFLSQEWPPAGGSPETVPAVITETFQASTGKGIGDPLSIPTPEGPVPATIRGVYADYGSEMGTVAIPASLLIGRFPGDEVLNMAVTLRDGADPDLFAGAIRSKHPQLVVRLNREIREEALKIFHQTFAVTYALQIIGLVVAVAGLALALVSLWLERIPQIRTWQELGITRNQTARVAAIEGLLLSVTGAISGLILSFGLGWLLIYVINRQSFGWTLNFHLPLAHLPLFAVAVLLLGGGVSILIGRWGFRQSGNTVHE